MFSKLFQVRSYGFYVWLARIFGIDQNLIQIYHNKDIKFFSKDFVDIAPKTGWCVRKAKKHNLVLNMAVYGTKAHLPLIAFSNPHLRIGTSEIQLSKLLDPA